MVSKFRRTLSSPTAASRKSPPPEKPCHVRSVSLPCRSHPLISSLGAEIRDLRSWTAAAAAERSSSWTCDGLARLKSLHDSVDDLLLLPQSRDSLRRRPDLVEKLLEDRLSFVDLYGRLREALAVFREEHLAAQIAARRRDETRAVDLTSGSARKTFEKEMIKLLETLRSIGRWSDSEIASGTVSMPDGESNQPPDLAGILREVEEATVAVTGRVVGAMCGRRRMGKGWTVVMSSLLWKMKRRGGVVNGDDGDDGEEVVEVERMREVESEVERVLRSLIGSRVTLLNLITHLNTCC